MKSAIKTGNISDEEHKHLDAAVAHGKISETDKNNIVKAAKAVQKAKIRFSAEDAHKALRDAV